MRDLLSALGVRSSAIGMEAIYRNPNTVKPPPGQESEDYYQTLIDFDRWCDDRNLPTQPTMNAALRACMAGNPLIVMFTASSAPCRQAKTIRPDRDPDIRGRRMIAKIEAAKHLLITTDKPFKVIAVESGFTQASNLATALRRHTGQTCKQFRAAHRKGKLTDERPTAASS